MRLDSGSLASISLRAVLAAGLLGGCVYYNGMYNANRLANSARKAERDGRTFEANNLWGQVATKAESVVVRHPRSTYAEEAALLRGLALAHLGQCEQALAPLGRVAVANVSMELREDAWLASGRCHVSLGNMPAADDAFAQVLDSKHPGRRGEARFQRARTLRHAGRYEEALAALDGVKGRRAVPELLLALAGAGRVSEAMVLADSLVAQGDTTQPWDTLVVTLARQDPFRGSSLVDRIRRLPNRTPETQARWLLEDGVRLAGVDTARAASRFREVIKLGGAGPLAARATFQQVRLDLRAIRHPHELSPLIEALRGLAQSKTAVMGVPELRATAAGVLATFASLMPGSPQGDLRLFLAAEAARDSLLAPRLAEGIFLQILKGWPESPYAPKAVLAAQQLNPAWGDSAKALLEGRYIDSPYLAMTRGEGGSAYRQLEDSLGAFAASGWARGPAVAPARRAPAAGQPGRPRPAPGARVPEP